MTTHYFYVKPVSTLTFALVELSGPPPSSVIVSESLPMNLDLLSYNGLYRFLFIVQKMDPMSLGQVASIVRGLPNVDLTKGPQPPAEFVAQNPIDTLRRQLKQFLSQWFNLSVEAQQKTAVNPAVGVTPWENKNMIRPQLPDHISQGTNGTRIMSFEEQVKQRKTIAELILDVQALNESVANCTSGDGTACAQATNTVKKIDRNVKSLSI